MAKTEVRKLGVNKSGWWEFSSAMRQLIPFSTGGALEGGPDSGYLGRLSDPERSEFVTARNAGEVDYVVLSYATPIAWHNSRTGEWVYPLTKYSVTTSKHQGKIFTACSTLNGDLIKEGE